MKKLLLIRMKSCLSIILFLGFLNSCTRSENLSEYSAKNSENTGKIFKSVNSSSSFAMMLNADPLDRCGSGYTPIDIDRTLPYYDDYNVYCYDGYVGEGGVCESIGNNKPCIDLSHFLATKGAYIHRDVSNTGIVRSVPIFYGYNQEMAFNSYIPSGSGTLYSQSFAIGGDSNSYFFTGGIGGTMPTEAANTVLHFFRNQVATLPVSYSGSVPVNAKIVAVHFSVVSYLCIPALREVKMSVKYRY
jgi:hypothetical protein